MQGHDWSFLGRNTLHLFKKYESVFPSITSPDQRWLEFFLGAHECVYVAMYFIGKFV